MIKSCDLLLAERVMECLATNAEGSVYHNTSTGRYWLVGVGWSDVVELDHSEAEDIING